MVSRLYSPKDRTRIEMVIGLVCAESEWMDAKSFIPTYQWLHAFSNLNCQMHALFVAEENDVVVGWCRIFPEKCNIDKNFGELGIGLLPNYRNQKIGYKLMETSCAWALKNGIKQIDLTVNVNNKIAFHLFDKFGFKIAARQANTLLMSLNI